MVQLIITFENGQVGITSPIQDKVLCLGILEIAKKAVLDFKVDGLIIPKEIQN